MPFVVKGLFVAGNVEFKMSRPTVEVILKAHIATGTFDLILFFLYIFLCAKHTLALLLNY